MPRKSDAKDKLIRTAARLFRERGYHAVGLTEILVESGAPKGSFYHHFPDGKDQLAEHALLHAGKKVEISIDEIFQKAEGFEDGVMMFAELLADLFEQSRFQAGCPIATIVLETTPQSERLHKSAQAAYHGWIAKIAEYGSQLWSGSEKEIEEKANAIILAFEGAWLIARINKSKEPFYLAARMCAALYK